MTYMPNNIKQQGKVVKSQNGYFVIFQDKTQKSLTQLQYYRLKLNEKNQDKAETIKKIPITTINESQTQKINKQKNMIEKNQLEKEVRSIEEVLMVKEEQNKLQNEVNQKEQKKNLKQDQTMEVKEEQKNEQSLMIGNQLLNGQGKQDQSPIIVNQLLNGQGKQDQSPIIVNQLQNGQGKEDQSPIIGNQLQNESNNFAKLPKNYENDESQKKRNSEKNNEQINKEFNEIDIISQKKFQNSLQKTKQQIIFNFKVQNQENAYKLSQIQQIIKNNNNKQIQSKLNEVANSIQQLKKKDIQNSLHKNKQQIVSAFSVQNQSNNHRLFALEQKNNKNNEQISQKLGQVMNTIRLLSERENKEKQNVIKQVEILKQNQMQKNKLISDALEQLNQKHRDKYEQFAKLKKQNTELNEQNEQLKRKNQQNTEEISNLKRNVQNAHIITIIKQALGIQKQSNVLQEIQSLKNQKEILLQFDKFQTNFQGNIEQWIYDSNDSLEQQNMDIIKQHKVYRTFIETIRKCKQCFKENKNKHQEQLQKVTKQGQILKHQINILVKTNTKLSTNDRQQKEIITEQKTKYDQLFNSDQCRQKKILLQKDTIKKLQIENQRLKKMQNQFTKNRNQLQINKTQLKQSNSKEQEYSDHVNKLQYELRNNKIQKENCFKKVAQLLSTNKQKMKIYSLQDLTVSIEHFVIKNQNLPQILTVSSILKGCKQQRQYLITIISSFSKREVKDSILHFQSDSNNQKLINYLPSQINSYKYFVLLMLSNKGHIFGVFSQGISTEQNKYSAFLFSLTNKRNFYRGYNAAKLLATKIENEKFLVFGNDQLRIKSQSLASITFKNQVIGNKYFQVESKQQFTGQQHSSVSIRKMQLHQIFFK